MMVPLITFPGLGTIALNVAVTAVFPLIVIEHAPDPEHAPDHAAKTYPMPGAGVRFTTVEGGYPAVHAIGQDISE